MKNKKFGFTLIEMLIYITLVAIISLIVGGSFISLNSSRGRVEARAEVNSAIRIAMERIKQDLKDATGLQTPTVGSTSTSLVVNVNSDTITYDLSGGAIRRKVNSNDPADLTASVVTVSAITFEYFHNLNMTLLKIAPSVKVTITAQYNSTDPSHTYSQTRYSTYAIARLFDISRPQGTSTSATSPLGIIEDLIP